MQFNEFQQARIHRYLIKYGFSDKLRNLSVRSEDLANMTYLFLAGYILGKQNFTGEDAAYLMPIAEQGIFLWEPEKEEG